jgi:flagellar biosynthesis protein FlhF
MHVKRLYRPTVREALAAARQELGAGALVLSTELVPAPGWRGWIGHRTVRLTAAAERPETAQTGPEMVSDDRPVTDRRHLRNTAQEGLIARLCASGLSRALAEAVVDRMTPGECRGGSEGAVRKALSAELDAARGDDEDFARCEVFIGPPGVGKTTTIAKIAAQERAGTRRRRLALVSADGFRPGAMEQLRCYAHVLGAPFRAVRSPSDLGAALDAARHTAFVDTPGRSPSDSELTDLLAVFEPRRDVRTHLVLAASTAPASANRLLDTYTPLKPSRVVITKLDEAESVLPLFNVLRERGLPISYLAMGQRVPEDLERATPASLAAALLQEPIACH